MISCARIRLLFYDTPFRKSHKKLAEDNLFFNFVLLYAHALFFVICGHFTTLKWLKVLKLSKICFEIVKAMTKKKNNKRSEYFVSQ